ncbi:MAG: hypothetical protein LBC19_03520 [Tannerella sp.]|jgi:hypothetical protein|nr:hypothetical protein [Tannerella sp.]
MTKILATVGISLSGMTAALQIVDKLDRKYAKRIAKMEQLLKIWVLQQGDTGASVDIEFVN